MKNLAFIFDIDGTLVNLQKTWEEHYVSLYQEQCGFTLTSEELKAHFGPPELESHTTTLKQRGLYTAKKAQQLVDITEKNMVNLLSQMDLRPAVLPGVFDCLESLKRGSVGLGCATGNIQPIAESILRAAALRNYFLAVACSLPQTIGRYEIVSQAIDALQQQLKISFEPQEVFVIGDTPSDIKAAKQLGYVSVAVATGNYLREELAAHQPDMLLTDLTRFPSFLEKA